MSKQGSDILEMSTTITNLREKVVKKDSSAHPTAAYLAGFLNALVWIMAESKDTTHITNHLAKLKRQYRKVKL